MSAAPRPPCDACAGTPDSLANQLAAQFPDGVDVGAMPRVLGRLVRLAARHPWRAGVAVACAFGAAVANLLMPRLLGRAVDQAVQLASPSTGTPGPAAHVALQVTALLLVGACVVRGLLTGLQGYFGETLAQHVGYDLRLAFYDKLQRMSFSWHDGIHTGELIARGMLDLEGVRAFVEFGVLRAVTVSLLLGVGAARLLHLDHSLGLLALSFAPVVLVLASRSAVRLRISWQHLQRMMAALTLRMEENLQGMRVVRAFHARLAEMARFDAVSSRALALSNRRITQRMTAHGLMTLAYYTSMGLVLWAGGRRIAAGTLSVGALTEFLTFMTILQQPLRQVGLVVNAGARATGSGARLFEVLDAEPAIADAPGAAAPPPGPKTLCFENVGFAYGNGRQAKQVLHDISFELRPGQVLGIVGAPGSGKSTIAHLIPRFYDPTSGRVTLGGQDLRGLQLDALRRDVALVQQENFLFDASVHDNVAYAVPDAGTDAVVGAARTAQVHEQVGRMARGYATRVGERGANLSGGQRQRLTIARALVGAPAVIVLDDSTAAVDPVTEGQVRAALGQACRDAATIVIAHRLAALRHADEIIVLDAGRIVERGHHAALLALDGRYAALWRLQQRAARDTAAEPRSVRSAAAVGVLP